MAITANVDLGNGASASSCYIIVPNAYVKKFRPEEDGKSARDDYNRVSKQIRCREVDHHKIDYDPTTSDNPFKLAYTHLKTNSKLSSVSDA